MAAVPVAVDTVWYTDAREKTYSDSDYVAVSVGSVVVVVDAEVEVVGGAVVCV